MLVLISILAYSASLVLFQSFFPLSETQTQLNFHFATLCLSSICYWYIIKNKTPPPSIKLAIPLIFIAFLVTPNLLQNDQFRYIWDGANSANLINPFEHAPNKHPFFKQTRWAQIINHPDLKTIYPPLAQIAFLISHKLNPVFWFQDFKGVTNLHFVVLGLKILFGIITALYIYLIRKKNWHLIIAHPLFLYTAIANNHVDTLLIMPISLILMNFAHKHKDQIVNISLSAMILIKWFPFIFLPPIMLWNIRKNGLSRALSQLVLILALIFFSTMIFYKGVSTGMFSSLATFGEKWFFNGYFHLIFGDFLGLFIDRGAGYLYSKYTGFVLAASTCILIMILMLKKKLNTATAFLFILLTYFTFTPTLMPWYMLALLPFLLMYKKTPTILWLWPMITLSSKIYFYNYKDPIFIRYIAYSIITYFFIKALRNKSLLIEEKN